MLKAPFLKKLSKDLIEALPSSLKTAKKDLEKNCHLILNKTFTSLDLVTREEFEAQTKVLARTRKKLEDLEKLVATLEKKKGKA